ncbi:MAG: hypothetical protein RL026_345 [Pseudomonadota bacterium]|jgi:cation:H+ antiporter
MNPLAGFALVGVAILMAAAGSKVFLDGLEAFSRRGGLSGWLVAGSLGAAATSMPELMVSWLSAFEGRPELGLGDALGSNVVNTALILGLALLWRPLQRPASLHREDMLFALLSPAVLAALLADGQLQRLEAVGLLALFVLWLHRSLKRDHHRDATAAPAPQQAVGLLIFGRLLAGVLLLLAAGQAFVSGGTRLAASAGVPEYVLGASVVAFGTSLPEMATLAMASWRGRSDLGMGALLGSNLFNGLAIVGTTGMIAPVRIDLGIVAPALGAGLLALLCLAPGRSAWRRWRALPLLSIYVLFVVATTLAARA